LISVLVHGVMDGERLSDDEIVQDALLILVGGDETSRHTLSGGTAQLLSHPDQYEALRADPDRLMANAVEEMLRWTSPVKNMCRILTADTEFHGSELKQGGEDHVAVRVGGGCLSGCPICGFGGSRNYTELSLGARTYLVTGGGSGIGKCVAATLVGARGNVLIVGRGADKLETAVNDIRAAVSNGAVKHLSVDVTDEEPGPRGS
jgi:hypothetical protein